GGVCAGAAASVIGWSVGGTQEACGASTKIMNELDPPSPRELAADTHRRCIGQLLPRVLTKNGLFAKSILWLGLRKLRLAGILPFFTARAALIKAAIPAVCSRCPTLVLTDATAQKLRHCVPVRKARAKASISNGSPTTVPVP